MADARQITTIAAGTIVAIFYPKFRSPEWRPLRAGMFVAMGLSAVFPVLHGLQRYGYRQMEQQISLSWMVGQGALYIAGAAIYAVSAGGMVGMQACMHVMSVPLTTAAGTHSGEVATRRV